MSAIRNTYVTSFERKMIGISQSVLIGASDGRRYVLKFYLDQGAEMRSFHEALGSRLLAFLDLPVPHWRPLFLAQEFIDENPDMWPFLGTALDRPTAGLYFGSEFIEAEVGARTYQLIPRKWLSRIRNTSDFLGMLIVDIWTNHLDNRQALFHQAPDSSYLEAVFVDHGHMFGDPAPMRRRIGRSRFLDTSVYDLAYNLPALCQWVQRIRNIDRSHLEYLVETIPPCWRNDSYTEHVLESLVDSQAALSNDLEEIASLLGGEPTLLLGGQVTSTYQPLVF